VERGGPSAAVDGWHWPVSDERRWAACAHVAQRRVGEVGSLTRGPGATVTGGVV
jgi:hypothetical protein